MSWDAGAAGSRIDLRGLKKQATAAGARPSPSPSPSPAAAAAGQALTLKEAGNTAFKAGDLVEAVRLYTAALGSEPSTSLKVLLLSNRAEVQLQQQQFDGACADQG